MNRQGYVIREERIKFPKDKQKEFLEWTKKYSNLSWKGISKLLDVSEHTVKNVWGKEITTIPKSHYKRLLNLIPKEQQNKFKDIKTFEKNWGQSKGGKLSINKIHKLNIIKKSPQILKDSRFAELIGIILGDGHISSKYIRITLEYPYELLYANYISSIVENLFGVKAIIKTYKKNSEIRININSKSLVEFLHKVGLKSGNKIHNDVGIPIFVLKRKDLLIHCLRGLIDTDGGFYSKDKKGTRIIMEFKSKTKKLRRNFKFGMKKIGFTISKSPCFLSPLRL